MKMKFLAKLSATILLLVGSPALPQATNSQAPSLPSQQPSEVSPNTSHPDRVPSQGVEPLIGIGDLVRVTVMGAPEFDQEIRVGADGSIHLQLAGAVHIAGLTTEQAEQAIRKRLIDGGYFADPQVSVFEKDYATQGVSVLGEVQRPGVYPVTGPRRLFDVLSLAGGTTPKAGQNVSITHRDQPQSMRTVTMSRDPAENIKANVDIFPADTVVVSKAGLVYVVGDVRKPTVVVLETSSNISVLQAIAVAEGTNASAKLNGTKIIRRTPSGTENIPVKLKKIMASKAPDLKLEAEDIVFVPASAGKKAGETALATAKGIAQSLAVYSVFY
jgi:polysaccharide biosynthesis/export protein